MLPELAAVNRPVPVWFYLLLFGGPVALVSLVWWMGKRGWIKLAGRPRGQSGINPATGLPMLGLMDTGGNLYGFGRSSSSSDE